MICKCQTCRKDFVILYPQMWSYKHGKTFYCSWSCLRAKEEKRKEAIGDLKRRRLTLEEKKKAVQLSMTGGDPLRYLEGLGIKDPVCTWYHIKKWVKGADPETHAKLPERTERKDSVKKQVKIMEEPEKVAIVKDPENNEPPRTFTYRVLELETQLAKYTKMEDGDLVITDKSTGNGMRLCAEECYQLIVELPEVMRFMGVK